MSQVFIAFYGHPEPVMKQEENIYVTAENFECWNLRNFSAEEFMNTIKTKIPPINDNVLINYLNEGAGSGGISKEQYGDCLWGLLLPDPERNFSNSKEVNSLLNLFSTKYMSPAFFVTDMGIRKENKFIGVDVEPNDHQRYEDFKTTDFVSFYNTMIDQMKYFTWRRDTATTWTEEDWRLFMAAGFYEGLEEYSKGKTSYTWQRESADMATLLETLFTAGDSQNEEIGYRLRKRVGSLIKWKFNDIEKEIKVLYKDRSDFVHGNYYTRIIREMRGNQNDNAMLPPPDFEKLYTTKERIRFIFVAYLYLHKTMMSRSEQSFATYTSVQQMLEDAVLDTELRLKIIETIEPVIDLLPEA
ncbi:MAG: hypothetical protein WC444_02790 [Candidatus Paceibacterota bacterium]